MTSDATTTTPAACELCGDHAVKLATHGGTSVCRLCVPAIACLVSPACMRCGKAGRRWPYCGRCPHCGGDGPRLLLVDERPPACLVCGYDQQALPRRADCPECGAGIGGPHLCVRVQNYAVMWIIIQRATAVSFVLFWLFTMCSQSYPVLANVLVAAMLVMVLCVIVLSVLLLWRATYIVLNAAGCGGVGLAMQRLLPWRRWSGESRLEIPTQRHRWFNLRLHRANVVLPLRMYCDTKKLAWFDLMTMRLQSEQRQERSEPGA